MTLSPSPPMASRHRKLLDESLPEIIATLCEENCAEPQKYNLTCPIPCFNFCPLNSCKLSIISFPPPPPPPLPPLAPAADANKPHAGPSAALTISLAVLAAAFFLFTCYTLYKFYTVWKNSRRQHRPREEAAGAEDDDDGDDFLDEEAVDHPIWYIRTIGLQPSVINAITIVKYKSADGLVEGTDCAVCLSEFQEDETLRLLPKCSHAFHIPCIDTWLASHTNCPMCRAGIVSNAPGPVQLHETPDHHSARVDEALPEVSRSEADIEFEGDNLALAQIRAEMNENGEGTDCKMEQPMRRSVSMDSVSASMISAAVASAFPRQCSRKKVEEVGNRPSSSSLKRSASCSAKVFLSRHSSRR